MADFLMIGGDARQRYLAAMLREDGHRVRLWGVAADPQDMIGDSPIVCLPVPSFRRGRVPGDADTSLDARAALERVRGRHCAAYCEPEEKIKLLEAGALSVLNLAEDEKFLTDNAEITAEGAILAVSGNGGRSLWGSRCLILGYGRIGKALARRLSAMGAQCFAAARREEVRLEAKRDGVVPCGFDEIPFGMDFVFNTVPAQLLSAAGLAESVGSGLYAELASAPYGVDPGEAARCGLRVLPLPGVPGKRFAFSAARCIREAYLRGFSSEILSQSLLL